MFPVHYSKNLIHHHLDYCPVACINCSYFRVYVEVTLVAEREKRDIICVLLLSLQVEVVPASTDKGEHQSRYGRLAELLEC